MCQSSVHLPPAFVGAPPLTEHVSSYSPALYDLSVFRWAMPYVSHFGTSAFRRKVLEWIPFKRLHKLKDVVDIMHRRAAEIYQEKKMLLEKGDEALLAQVGEGKDLMSILREQRSSALRRCSPPTESDVALLSEGEYAGIGGGQTVGGRAHWSDGVRPLFDMEFVEVLARR